MQWQVEVLDIHLQEIPYQLLKQEQRMLIPPKQGIPVQLCEEREEGEKTRNTMLTKSHMGSFQSAT